MTERWAAVNGYEGIYEVSTLGRVRSLDRVIEGRRFKMRFKGRVLRPSINRYGYAAVILSIALDKENKLVHRLVAEAFCPKQHEDDEVNHINCCKSDNRYENLEWISRSENTRHAERAGRRNAVSNPTYAHKLTLEDVREMRALSKKGVSYNKLVKKYGVVKSTVASIVTGKIWTEVSGDSA